MEKFKFKIDTSDGSVWLWDSIADDEKFVFVNTVAEVKDTLSSEAFNFRAKAKEFSEMAKRFKASDAIS